MYKNFKIILLINGHEYTRYCYWILKVEEPRKLSDIEVQSVLAKQWSQKRHNHNIIITQGIVKENRLWYCVYDFVLHHSSNNFQPLKKFEEFSKPDELADTVGDWKCQCSMVHLLLFTLLKYRVARSNLFCTSLHDFTLSAN